MIDIGNGALGGVPLLSIRIIEYGKTSWASGHRPCVEGVLGRFRRMLRNYRSLSHPLRKPAYTTGFGTPIIGHCQKRFDAHYGECFLEHFGSYTVRSSTPVPVSFSKKSHLLFCIAPFGKVAKQLLSLFMLLVSMATPLQQVNAGHCVMYRWWFNGPYDHCCPFDDIIMGLDRYGTGYLDWGTLSRMSPYISRVIK